MNNLQHLAVIMDGNGRWAKRRALLRTDGHKRGSEVIDLLCEFCLENSVKTLTLYAFSTENWSRPKAEVGFLLKLLGEFLTKKENEFLQNQIRFRAIGDITKFEPSLQSKITHLQEATQSCAGLNLLVGLNYGGKDEIVRAVRKLVEKIRRSRKKTSPKTSTQQALARWICSSAQVAKRVLATSCCGRQVTPS